MKSEEILPWCDTETFGLDPQRSPIIEIGFRVTDLNLNVIHDASWLAWGSHHEMIFQRWQDGKFSSPEDEFVYKMHKESGLFEDARETGINIANVQVEIKDWLHEHLGAFYGEMPLCGSTIDFDRATLNWHMSSVNKFFHYRSINVSSIKELCRRYNPEVYAHKPEPRKLHRVLPDLIDTVEEFRFYRDEFLLW